jgi:hypothetical protein
MLGFIFGRAAQRQGPAKQRRVRRLRRDDPLLRRMRGWSEADWN